MLFSGFVVARSAQIEIRAKLLENILISLIERKKIAALSGYFLID